MCAPSAKAVSLPCDTRYSVLLTGYKNTLDTLAFQKTELDTRQEETTSVGNPNLMVQEGKSIPLQ